MALPWDEANRQAFQEMRGRRADWDWWNLRRRELAGYPREAPRQRINRGAFLEMLVRGKGMKWWRRRRAELLEAERGVEREVAAGLPDGATWVDRVKERGGWPSAERAASPEAASGASTSS